MQYHDDGHQERHGGMNHGMGMMMLGCVVPMAAIVLLPRMGVSSVGALLIGVVGMIVFHARMMGVQRLRNRKSENAGDSIHSQHQHE